MILPQDDKLHSYAIFLAGHFANSVLTTKVSQSKIFVHTFKSIHISTLDGVSHTYLQNLLLFPKFAPTSLPTPNLTNFNDYYFIHISSI